jgi:hypothetical protein
VPTFNIVKNLERQRDIILANNVRFLVPTFNIEAVMERWRTMGSIVRGFSGRIVRGLPGRNELRPLQGQNCIDFWLKMVYN